MIIVLILKNWIVIGKYSNELVWSLTGVYTCFWHCLLRCWQNGISLVQLSFVMKTKTCKQFTKRRKRKRKRKRKEMFKWTKSVLKISIGLMKTQFSLQMHGDLFIAFYHITGWKASTYDWNRAFKVHYFYFYFYNTCQGCVRLANW